MTLHRMIRRSPSFNRLPLALLLMVILALPGCAHMRDYLATSLPMPGYPDDTVARNDFLVAPGDDVVGRLAKIRLRKGDTLPDVARHFSLGINTVSAANPGTDVWVPGTWERVLLPMSFILPDTPRKWPGWNVQVVK